MADIPNPYAEVRHESVGESERRLADIIVLALDLKATEDEKESLAKVLGMTMRNYPFWRGIIDDKIVQDVLKRGT